MARQEKLAGRPAMTSSRVSETIFKVAGRVAVWVRVHARANNPIVERSRQAAQIELLRQLLDQGLGFAKLLGESYPLLRGQKQQPVLRKNRPPPRLQNGVEM